MLMLLGNKTISPVTLTIKLFLSIILIFIFPPLLAGVSIDRGWKVINDAPYLITKAPPAIKDEGESLKKLGFKSRKDLLNSIDKSTQYRSIAFSPDGHFIVSGSNDNLVNLWDIKSLQLLHTFKGHTNTVNSVVFSHNGRFIASGSHDGYIKIWDFQNRELIISFKNPHSIYSISFSHDDRYIVSGSPDNSVNIWDIQSGTLTYSFEGKSRSTTPVAFSQNGRFIISGAYDNSIKLWDIQNRTLVHSFKGHTRSVTSLAFSYDSRFIVSGSYDTTLKLWDIQNQKIVHTFEGHSSNVNSVTFSPDDNFIVSGSWDKTIKLWDILNQKIVHTYKGYSDPVYSIAISPDSRFIAAGSRYGSIQLWDIQNQQLVHSLKGHSNYIQSFAFSNDGHLIASSSLNNTIKLWDIQNQKLLYTLTGHSRAINTLTFSDDGRFIASGSSDNTVKLWDIKNKKLLQTFVGHSNTVNSVFFSNDAQFLVSGSSDGTVKLWDINNQKLRHSFEQHTRSVNAVVFSKDGMFIASGSLDKTVKFWDVQNKQLLHSFEGHTDNIYTIAFNNTGRFIASGSKDHSVKLWDTKNQKIAHTFKESIYPITSLAFSNNDYLVATESFGGKVNLWNIKNKKLIDSFEGYSNTILGVEFSKNDDVIVTGLDNNTVKFQSITKPSQSSSLSLLSSRDDSWLIVKDNDLVFRADQGNLLRKKMEKNDWTSILPTDVNLQSDFSISVSPIDLSISAGQKNESLLHVTITNTGSGSAFWLKLKPTQSLDNSVRIDPPDNRLKVKEKNNWNAPYISRLEPGESKTLHARISTNLKFPTDFVSPGLKSLTITVVSANGSETSQTINIDVKLPKLEWQKASLESDGKSLKVLLKNTGTAVLNESFVQLISNNLNKNTEKESTSKQIISELAPGESIELAFILPKKANLLYLLKTLFNPELLHLQGQSNQLPVFSWKLTTNDITWILLWWIGFFLLLILIALWYFHRYRHPLVIQLSHNPESLSQLAPEQLSEAYHRLSQTSRLETVLSKNDVTERTFLTSIDFFKSHSDKQKIQFLETQLGTQAILIDNHLWELPLPDSFPLNLQHCLVYFPDVDTAASEVFNLLKTIPETNRKITLLIGPDSQYQRDLYSITKDLSNKFVAPIGFELTQLTLSSEPELVLAEILSSQIALTLLSPYQLGGGVNSDSIFFGRQDIIDHILNRDPANYLLAGGRQLGKSSLLKALDRRFNQQGYVISIYLALSSEILIPKLISLLKLPKGSSLDALAEYAEESEKRLVFLIDEADKFIRKEQENDYQILDTLRKLSEEGHCHFILAGFWELFQHAVLNYQSPLKNFAETIQIGALEPEACRHLATVPMQTMRLTYDSPDLIDYLLHLTGGRANLIAIVCHQIIEKLSTNQRKIEKQDIDKALYSEKTFNALKGWGNMSDDPQACRLDRIIVYTTVTQSIFSLDQLFHQLQEHAVKVKMQMIEHSLTRLELGFILRREKNNQYVYQVPLFQEMIINESPATKLEIEVDDWNSL